MPIARVSIRRIVKGKPVTILPGQTFEFADDKEKAQLVKANAFFVSAEEAKAAAAKIEGVVKPTDSNSTTAEKLQAEQQAADLAAKEAAARAAALAEKQADLEKAEAAARAADKTAADAKAKVESDAAAAKARKPADTSSVV